MKCHCLLCMVVFMYIYVCLGVDRLKFFGNGNIIILMLFQSLAIPHVLEGKNTLICAETGNGKTLAFIGPMLQQIKERNAILSELPMNSPLGLVIAPGKELATQIHVSPSSCPIPCNSYSVYREIKLLLMMSCKICGVIEISTSEQSTTIIVQKPHTVVFSLPSRDLAS